MKSTRKDVQNSSSSNSGGGVDAAVGAAISIDQFSNVLGAIYDSAFDSGAWSEILEGVRKLLGGNYASLIVLPGSASNLSLIVSASSDRRAIDTNNPPIAMSPFTGLQPDRLVTISDVLTEAEWRASPYYRDWCQRHGVFHVMAADIGTRDGSVYGFRVTRPEDAPAFSPAELDLARRLLPHIKRALNLYLTMNQDRRVNTLYGHAMTQLMIGVVVLDQTGEVIEVNPAAKAILDMSDGLRVIGRQLEATYANDNRKLQRLIRDALMHPEASKMALTEAMPISRPSGQQNWGAVVQSISSDQWSEGRQRPSVAVFVRDTDGKAAPPVRLAQQLFQLTPAETALAIQLANGLSLEEAAEALNIRRNTARAHLRSIFSKTGVRRQTELVRIFLNSVAWLGARE